MKKNLHLKRAFASILFLAVCLAWIQSYSWDTGPGPGYSNAPSDGNCTSCHGGSVNSPGTNLTIDNGQTDFEYLPDSTYTITITFKSLNSRTTMGFETTALLSSDNSPAGTFSNTSVKTQKVVQVTSGVTRQYIEHTSNGIKWSSGTAQWSFQWKAPSSKVGDIKFYVIINDANGDATSGGDKIYGNVFTMPLSTKLPVASIKSSANSACVGDSIQFFGSSTNTPATYKWAFSGANITSSTLQNPKVRFISKGIKTVTLNTTNSTGVSDPVTKAVDITNKPDDTIGVSGSSAICRGSSVTLTAPIAGSYNWSTGATSQSIVVKDTGLYFATLSNGACSINSKPVHVTFLPLPTATISASFSGDTICANQSVTLISKAGYKQYDFYNNNTLLKSDTAHTLTFVPTLSHDVFYVVVYNSGGCADTSDTIQAFSRIRLKTPILSCGTSTTSSITMNWNAITGAAHYEVSEDSGKTWILPSSGPKGLSHTVSNLTFSQSLALRVRAASYSSGCTASLDGVGVCTTKSCSGITYDISADTVVCAGHSASINFSNISSNKYSIVLNSGAATKTANYSFTPISDTTEHFQIIDSFNLGCPPVDIRLKIRVVDLPQFSVAGGNSTYCAGENVTVTATGNYPRYIFYKNGSKVQDGASSTFTYPTTSGNSDSIRINAINSSGCEGIPVTTKIIIHDRPKSDFSYMRQDSAYQFIDLSPESNGNPADSFVLRRMWQFGDGASSTDKSPLHHYANDGEYNVKLVVFNPSGCSDSIEKRIDYKLGIKNSSLSSNLIVSPNPFRNYVELRFNMEKPAEYRIRLVNSTGIQVLNWQTYSLTQGINTIRLNTSNLPYGTYLLQITDGISSAATTIIKNE